jgi:hypothetical protein
MTSTNNPEPGTILHQAFQHAREGAQTGNRTRPYRMPVMGWLREISAVENWRTGTIVRRHRDSAATPAP